MPPSPTLPLKLASTAIGTIFIGFGINALLRPQHALTFFEFDDPVPAPDAVKTLINNLMLIYGVRDIFMGLVIYIAGIWGDKKVLGGTLLATSAVAFADGAVCWMNGAGEWNHWGYAPMVAGVGGLVLGG